MEKAILETFTSIKSVIPLLPTIILFIRRLFRRADECIVLDDLALKHLQYSSSNKTSLFHIEKSAFFLLREEVQRDLKQMRIHDFQSYTAQILPLLERTRRRYDDTYNGSKVYIVLNSVKLARKLGLKYHCLISDIELFNNEIKNIPNLRERWDLTLTRNRLVSEKMNEKVVHEYSSFNEMNKQVLNICKGELIRKLRVGELPHTALTGDNLGGIEEAKEDEL